MYILLSPLEEGLETLLEEFEEHLSNVALAVMQSLQGENVSKIAPVGPRSFYKQYVVIEMIVVNMSLCLNINRDTVLCRNP